MTDAINLGSFATDSLLGIKSLYSFPTVTAQYDRFQFPAGTSYQVPAGYKLVVSRLQFMSVTASSHFSLGYGDNAISDAVTVPTNWVHLSRLFPVLLALTSYKVDVYFEIPALKYGHILSGANSVSCGIYGVLREV